jgi:hypothetical protein
MVILDEMRPALGDVKASKCLLTAVIVKSFAETVLVCTVATLTAFAYFNPALRGEIEVVSSKNVQGWACDMRSAGQPLEVQLFIDNHFFAASRADILRTDLVTEGRIRNPSHGFNFVLADKQFNPGRHRAEVFVVHKAPGDVRTLLPIGKGKRFFQGMD